MTIIDLDIFVNNMVPPFLRKPRMLAWVKLQVFHVWLLWIESVSLYNAYIAELAVTIETHVLQAYLRTKYPLSAGNNVTVTTDNDSMPYFYTGYNNEHYAPMYGGYNSESFPIFTYYANEYRPMNNYTVKVPIAYQPQHLNIVAILNKYRPIGKIFQIIYI